MPEDGLRKIHEAGREIEQAGRALQNVTELRREPVAAFELTEAELEGVIEHLGRFSMLDDATGSARDKLEQGLAVESGAGGAFYSGGEAA